MSKKQWYETLFENYGQKYDKECFTQRTAGECNERYYLPCEITWLLKSLRFNGIEIFGAKPGAFSREDKLTTSDYEMLVIATKT